MTKPLRLAGCILLNERGEVLLLHRNTPRRTHWEIPGGKVEAGESEAETMVRELKEELGVDVRPGRQLLAREFTEDELTLHYVWFLGTVTAGVPAVGEPATFDDLSYFSRAQLRAVRGELSAGAQTFLDAWLAGEFSLTNN